MLSREGAEIPSRQGGYEWAITVGVFICTRNEAVVERLTRSALALYGATFAATTKAALSARPSGPSGCGRGPPGRGVSYSSRAGSAGTAEDGRKCAAYGRGKPNEMWCNDCYLTTYVLFLAGPRSHFIFFPSTFCFRFWTSFLLMKSLKLLAYQSYS